MVQYNLASFRCQRGGTASYDYRLGAVGGAAGGGLRVELQRPEDDLTSRFARRTLIHEDQPTCAGISRRSPTSSRRRLTTKSAPPIAVRPQAEWYTKPSRANEESCNILSRCHGGSPQARSLDQPAPRRAIVRWYKTHERALQRFTWVMVGLGSRNEDPRHRPRSTASAPDCH
jgi:hypothetical protein